MPLDDFTAIIFITTFLGCSIGLAVLMVALFVWSERRKQKRHDRLEARYDRLET